MLQVEDALIGLYASRGEHRGREQLRVPADAFDFHDIARPEIPEVGFVEHLHVAPVRCSFQT